VKKERTSKRFKHDPTRTWASAETEVAVAAAVVEATVVEVVVEAAAAAAALDSKHLKAAATRSAEHLALAHLPHTTRQEVALPMAGPSEVEAGAVISLSKARTASASTTLICHEAVGTLTTMRTMTTTKMRKMMKMTQQISR